MKTRLLVGLSLATAWSLQIHEAISQTAAPTGTPAIRTWVDGNGREIRASLNGFQDIDTLNLRMEDGRTFTYPIEKLSAADQAFAREAYGKEGTNPTVDWASPKQSKNYVIKGVRRENAPGFISIKGGWEYQIKSIEARIEYQGESESAPGTVSAYFYDQNGKLLEKVAKPPRRQDENRVYIETMDSFQKGKTAEAYFPLNEFLEQTGWATVLVVFGSGSDVSVEAMPARSLELLEFDEKKYVFPDWNPEKTSGSGTPAAVAKVDLEIRRIQSEKYKDFVVFNGDYVRGMPVISSEVRVTGEISPADGTVKLYLYDASGKLVGSKRNPSSAQIGGTDTYFARPRVADDRWHPVVFALDNDLAGKAYETILIVFQFGGKTSAIVESKVGSTVNSLDFPEKKDLTP